MVVLVICGNLKTPKVIIPKLMRQIKWKRMTYFRNYFPVDTEFLF